jgi:hypothetical protein
MRVDVLKRALFVSLVLLLPAAGFAQEATFAGAITDSTGGVLPGVTVTAVHDASGNTFTTVSDDRGEFRLPVRVGTYRISAELSGFTTPRARGPRPAGLSVHHANPFGCPLLA